VTFFELVLQQVRYKNRSALCKDYLTLWKQTFEISTNVLSISNKNIQSPLDGVDEILNLVTAELQGSFSNQYIHNRIAGMI